jgi:Cell wall-active antibiotics response LiaF, C-terminal
MYKRGYIFIGGALIVLGLIFLLGQVLHMDMCPFILALGLIGIGVVMILRPRFVPPGTAVDVRILGDVKRRGEWIAAGEELWVLIGDVTLDLTETQLLPGETTIRILGFVGSLKVLLPEALPLSVTSAAFLTSAKVFDRKVDTLLAPYEWASDGYAAAESRLCVEVMRFVSDLKIRHA